MSTMECWRQNWRRLGRTSLTLRPNPPLSSQSKYQSRLRCASVLPPPPPSPCARAPAPSRRPATLAFSLASLSALPTLHAIPLYSGSKLWSTMTLVRMWAAQRPPLPVFRRQRAPTAKPNALPDKAYARIFAGFRQRRMVCPAACSQPAPQSTRKAHERTAEDRGQNLS